MLFARILTQISAVVDRPAFVCRVVDRVATHRQKLATERGRTAIQRASLRGV
jgi:hypothetical protein